MEDVDLDLSFTYTSPPSAGFFKTPVHLTRGDRSTIAP